MKWKEVKPRCKHIEIGWARSWIVSFFPLMNINDTNFSFNWILLNARFFYTACCDDPTNRHTIFYKKGVDKSERGTNINNFRCRIVNIICNWPCT